MKFRNKWNKGIYEVVEYAGKMITLQREDKSQFTIQLSEFKANYEELKN